MSEQIMRENLVVLAQTFAQARGMSLGAVSKKIHGNHKFLEGFLNGEISTTIETYFRMLDALRREWPAGTTWPETQEVPRPSRRAYRAPTKPPKRDATGRFLGKKHSNRGRAA